MVSELVTQHVWFLGTARTFSTYFVQSHATVLQAMYVKTDFCVPSLRDQIEFGQECV